MSLENMLTEQEVGTDDVGKYGCSEEVGMLTHQTEEEQIYNFNGCSSGHTNPNPGD